MNNFLYFLFFIIFSVFSIFYLHEFWNTIVNNYSIKKTKDLVSTQTNKYIEIINDLQNNKDNLNNLDADNTNSVTVDQQSNMYNELNLL
tara:strand:+ start:3860 stop:4126 length:267 start_codon:yes stop_codon:yes gene_type:complete